MGLRALLLSEELIDGLPKRSLAVGRLGVGQYDPGIHRLQLQLLLRQSLDRIVWVGTSLEALPFPTVVPFDFPVPTGSVDLGTFVQGALREEWLARAFAPHGLEGTPLSFGSFRYTNDPSGSTHRLCSLQGRVCPFGEKFERNDCAACKR